MFVKPALGMKVRDPETRRHLPEAGAEVPPTTYWLRRLKAGDIVAAPPQRPAAQRSVSPSDKVTEKPPKGKE